MLKDVFEKPVEWDNWWTFIKRRGNVSDEGTFILKKGSAFDYNWICRAIAKNGATVLLFPASIEDLGNR